MGRFGGEAEALKQAESYFRIGRPDLAARVIKLAIAGNRNSPALWTGLGNALVAHGKGFLTPAAEFAYKKALTLTPGYPGALYFYAIALVENERVEDARPLFKLLIDGIPADAPFRAQLKSDLERAGLVETSAPPVK
jgi:cytochrome c-type biogenesis protein CcmH